MKTTISYLLLLLVTGICNASDHFEGYLVGIKNGQLTMTDKDGMIETTYHLDDAVATTLDNQECKLSSLQRGYFLIVVTENRGDTEIVVKIRAYTLVHVRRGRIEIHSCE